RGAGRGLLLEPGPAERENHEQGDEQRRVPERRDERRPGGPGFREAERHGTSFRAGAGAYATGGSRLQPHGPDTYSMRERRESYGGGGGPGGGGKPRGRGPQPRGPSRHHSANIASA